jgi:hypothetical protein
MKKFTFILFIGLFSHACDFTGSSGEKGKKGDCNKNVFSDIDSALHCAHRSEKLLLFAFVKRKSERQTQLNWQVLADGEIISTAQNKYVLIGSDPESIALSAENSTLELLELIRANKNDTFFVVTNLALYPFRHFTNRTGKQAVLYELMLGDGP